MKPQVRYIAWAHYKRQAYSGNSKREVQDMAIVMSARDYWPNRPFAIPTWRQMQDAGWQIVRVVDNGNRPRQKGK